jgi:5'-nucleotidase
VRPSRLLLAFALLLAATPACAPRARRVTLVHLSDYHSHALPFYAEGREGQAGVARALAYLKEAKARPDTLVLSGGDTMNAGVPAWSDAYRCLEWPWFDGLVEAMALGNHDLDYGPAEFERCRASVSYPVLSANLLREDGTPYLLAGGKPYLVREVGGVRLGLFAVAGPDLQRLVKRELLPPGTRFGDPLEAARGVVRTLREEEGVDAVVFIGHQGTEDDAAMARAVPGIDLVLGTHSHHLGELARIPGTQAFHISPHQYLTHLSEVELRFEGRRLAGVEGRLVPMDATRPEDPEVAARVAALQAKLEAERPERFTPLATLPRALDVAGLNDGESPLGNWVTGVLRERAATHVFFTTSSSLRAALPPGRVTEEDFLTAVPYRNAVMTVELTGRQLLDWLSLSVARRGSDAFSVQTGLRYRVEAGRPVDVQVLRAPEDASRGYAPLAPEGTYRVGTTDFQATVAGGYRELAAAGRGLQRTPLDVHTVLREALAAGRLEAAGLDGRDGQR